MKLYFIGLLLLIQSGGSNFDSRYRNAKQSADSVVPARFFQHPVRQVNPDVNIILEPELRFTPNTKDLLIITRSSSNHFQRRDSIRLTWGNVTDYRLGKERLGVHVLFVMGKSNDSTINKLIKREAARHNDVLYADFLDTYANLTMKDIVSFKYGSKLLKSFHYLAIAGDEILVDVPGVIAQLRSAGEREMRRVAFCYEFPCCTPVIRDTDSKYLVQNGLYEGTHYPRYCSGTFFVLPMPIILELYQVALHTPYFMPDDAWLGVIYEKLSLRFVDSHTHYAGISSYRKELRILQHIHSGIFHKNNILITILDYAYPNNQVASKIIEVWSAYESQKKIQQTLEASPAYPRTLVLILLLFGIYVTYHLRSILGRCPRADILRKTMTRHSTKDYDKQVLLVGY